MIRNIDIKKISSFFVSLVKHYIFISIAFLFINSILWNIFASLLGGNEKVYIFILPVVALITTLRDWGDKIKPLLRTYVNIFIIILFLIVFFAPSPIEINIYQKTFTKYFDKNITMTLIYPSNLYVSERLDNFSIKNRICSEDDIIFNVRFLKGQNIDSYMESEHGHVLNVFDRGNKSFDNSIMRQFIIVSKNNIVLNEYIISKKNGIFIISKYPFSSCEKDHSNGMIIDDILNSISITEGN